MDRGAWRATVHRVTESDTTGHGGRSSGAQGLEPDSRAGSRQASLQRIPGRRLPTPSDPGPGWDPSALLLPPNPRHLTP